MLKMMDVALIVLLCIFAFSFDFLFSLSEKQGEKAIIKYNSQIYKELTLNNDKTVNITNGEGDTICTVNIENGKVWVSYAHCPDELCVEQGKIEFTNETIVCLPNKIVIEIAGGEKPRFDAISK